jgi:hypothetical protein
MYYYELKRAVFEAQLFEQDLEQELDTVAKGIASGQTDPQGMGGGQADDTLPGGLDGMNQAADPTLGQTPGQQPLNVPDEAPLGGEDELETEEALQRKIDSALVSATRNHPFNTKWRHTDNSKIAPYRILGYQPDDLHRLRTAARNLYQKETMSDRFGAYDSDEVRFYADLISFVERVLDIKKSGTKDTMNKKEGKTAKFDKASKPNTKAGKVKRK